MQLNSTWRRLCEYLGLSEYEAKVYVSLIEVGNAKARTLSMMSGVPRTKVYGALKKLIDMDLVVVMPEEPRKFVPTPPKTALKSYLRSYQSTVENLVSVISSLEEAFRKAKSEGKLRRGTIWFINGRQEILEKIREMLCKVKRSVQLVTNDNGMVLLYKSFNRIFDDLADRSVKVKITTPNHSNNQHMLNELKYTCKIEETHLGLPIIFLCIDEKQFLLANLQPDSFSPISKRDKGMFSDDPVLREMIGLLLACKS
ncbi:MAG: hypothetical protein NWF14_04525 [Candidatus Bathyarchaeota archaeon]|nr:hypothetical protein [Candidatus Bathyarchaeota archaeon]